MQTFSPLRHTSSPSKGFTLIELLISAAIITVVTSIVLVRFNAFDSTVLLKSTAYDVGMAIREAQIYAVSVTNITGGSDFRTPYGLHFVDNDSSYTFFKYTDVSPIGTTPSYSPTAPDSVSPIRTTPLGGSFIISKICAVGPNICTANGIGEMDISFRRPEFGAIFYTPSLTAGQLQSTSAVQIYVTSTRNPANVWIVEVKLLGQISAYLCTTNCT